MKNISIIGAGNMGAALAVGLSDAGYAVRISNRSVSKLERLRLKGGIVTTLSNTEVIDDADLLVIAVQPSSLADVVDEIGPRINYNHTIVASLLPEESMADLEKRFAAFNKAPMIARVMPNTAVAVGESMTFICLNEYSEAYSTEISRVFETVGKVEVIKESIFPSVMMLCSCGLAYAFRYIRAASEGGVCTGLEADDACRYVCQTLRGAAEMIERFRLHPEAAVDTVTTPGGITVRGLVAMEKAGFSPSVIAGLTVKSRSHE